MSPYDSNNNERHNSAPGSPVSQSSCQEFRSSPASPTIPSNIGDKSAIHPGLSPNPYPPERGTVPIEYSTNPKRWERRRCPPHRKKSIYVLQQAILSASVRENLNRSGTLLLRPDENFEPKRTWNSKEVRIAYGKSKWILDLLFEHHCGALEFGEKGRLHIHLFVLARENIEAGFCKAAYTKFMAGSSGFWDGLMEPAEEAEWLKKLPTFFNPNAHLQQIRERLNRVITKHGFKPVRVQDLAPLVKPPEAIAHYITKQLWTPSSDYPRFIKGTRMIILPKSFPKPVTRSFSWARGRGKTHRQKVGLIASYFSLDEQSIKVRFGKRNWMKVVGFLIASVQKQNPGWPEYRHPEFEPAEHCRFLVEWNRL